MNGNGTAGSGITEGIYTSNKIPIIDQVGNTAHELYGHGYFYSPRVKGQDINPFHDLKAVPSTVFAEDINQYEIVMTKVDVNRMLVEQIKRVTEQAIKNYKSRR